MRIVYAPKLVLLVAAAVVAVAPALAQSSDKAQSAPGVSSGNKAAPVKKTPAERRLDFVPSGSLTGTATQQTTVPAAGQSKPGSSKEGSHCHSKASDA
ncbi:MAG: hypothetical protein OEY03_09690 [Rhizobacter sp.]|nr:hypothetical protein [Rhizobacter sp.]